MKSFGKFILLFVFSFLYTAVFAQVKNNNDSISQHEQLNLKELEQPIPRSIGWINDFAGILAKHEIKNLDSIISNYEKKTTIEITVVTLDSTYVKAEDFDNYSLILAIKWGIGKKEKNNGILIAISADLRKIRIRNGIGIEKLITNAETKQIIDEISIPYFRNSQYFEGLQSTILELIKKLEEKD